MGPPPPVPEVPPVGVPSGDRSRSLPQAADATTAPRSINSHAFAAPAMPRPSQSRLRLQPAYQPALAETSVDPPQGRPCHVTTSARMRYGPSTMRRSPNQGFPVSGAIPEKSSGSQRRRIGSREQNRNDFKSARPLRKRCFKFTEEIWTDLEI